MLNWVEIVQKYISKHTNQIRKTTCPIRDHFGIEYFTYHRIDLAGKYTVLVDRPEWAEHYVEEQIFLNDPYLRHPDVYQSGFCLIENHGSEEYKKHVLRAGKKVLNIDSGVILIQKEEKFVEFFGFGANRENSTLSKLYVNQSYLLKSFANHFKSELRLILKQMDEEANTLSQLKGNDFFYPQTIYPNINQDSCIAYLNDIGQHCLVEKINLLSPREKQCLKLLLQHRSAKGIAAVLKLSRRTIESYFESIKNKLNCWSKDDVFKLAREFNDSGLLP